MNLLDAVVTKVKSEPFFDYEYWWVKVDYDCWSVKSETQLMFKTLEEAMEIKVGYKFLT